MHNHVDIHALWSYNINIKNSYCFVQSLKQRPAQYLCPGASKKCFIFLSSVCKCYSLDSRNNIINYYVKNV